MIVNYVLKDGTARPLDCKHQQPNVKKVFTVLKVSMNVDQKHTNVHQVIIAQLAHLKRLLVPPDNIRQTITHHYARHAPRGISAQKEQLLLPFALKVTTVQQTQACRMEFRVKLVITNLKMEESHA